MCEPSTRSAAAARMAAASTGNAISTSRLVTSVFQEKIGIRHIVMPGRAHRDDRRDEVHRAEDRAETAHAEAEHPQIAAHTRRERLTRQGLIREPSEGCRALGRQEAGDRDGRAEQEQPEGEGVQPRERDVRGADLQRKDGVREAGEQRRREHQQHDRAVHREQLVVLLLRRHDLHARGEQLGADDQRHHAAEHEEQHRGDQVHVPDRLVVGGGDPLDDDVALAAPRARR